MLMLPSLRENPKDGVQRASEIAKHVATGGAVNPGRHRAPCPVFTPCTVRLSHLALPEVHSFTIFLLTLVTERFLPVGCSSKVTEPKEGVVDASNLLPGLSEAQATIWACHWHLKSGLG